MKTFWQLLRIGFWMLPLQRALVVIGLLLVIVAQSPWVPLESFGSRLSATISAVTLVIIVPLLCGGVFLRMLSSSRQLLLRPHARGRLLGGALGVMVVAICGWILCYWAPSLALPAKYRPDAEVLLLLFAQAANFGTLCTIMLFIASRSLLWTLIVLVAWQAPGLLMHAMGFENTARLIGGPVSLGASVLAWVVFGIWFLRARRIHVAAWGRREGAASMPHDAGAAQTDLTPGQAMSRWVLANGTPLKMCLQVLCASLVLLALQWAFGRDAGVRPLQSMMFGVLATAGLVMAGIGKSMARRSRALWLPAGRTRLELHAWIERQMLVVAASIAASVAVAGAVAWLAFAPRPSLPPEYLFPALLIPCFSAGWLGLMQQAQRSFFDALAGIGIGATIFYGLVNPLYVGSAEPRWGILGAQVALAVLLREVAWVRWRGADWRRAQQA